MFCGLAAPAAGAFPDPVRLPGSYALTRTYRIGNRLQTAGPARPPAAGAGPMAGSAGGQPEHQGPGCGCRSRSGFRPGWPVVWRPGWLLVVGTGSQPSSFRPAQAGPDGGGDPGGQLGEGNPGAPRGARAYSNAVHVQAPGGRVSVIAAIDRAVDTGSGRLTRSQSPTRTCRARARMPRNQTLAGPDRIVTGSDRDSGRTVAGGCRIRYGSPGARNARRLAPRALRLSLAARILHPECRPRRDRPPASGRAGPACRSSPVSRPGWGAARRSVMGCGAGGPRSRSAPGPRAGLATASVGWTVGGGRRGPPGARRA